MRHLIALGLVGIYTLLSSASSPSDGSVVDEDGGLADAGDVLPPLSVSEQVVTGLDEAELVTVALAEGNFNAGTLGQLLITTYTGASACTLADPVGDAVEIRVNLERQAGCNYTTVVCTEEELCFAQSVGSAWAQVFSSSTLDDNVRAVAGAVTLSQEDFFSDTCTVEVDLGFADGPTFTASYELPYSGLDWCAEFAP